MPPTAIVDSGNGVQPLWVVAREPLEAPEALERVEAENKAAETALGAVGTHDVSRLLRLPGSLNFPNQKKKQRGRGVTRARLLHAAPTRYAAADAARLGAHLAALVEGTGLVRGPAGGGKKQQEKQQDHADGQRAHGNGHDGADRDDLLARLHKAMKRDATLARRWEGDTTGLQDRTRSALAFALGGALKAAGFARLEMGALLRSNPHTTARVAENGERGLDRIWERTGDGKEKKEKADDTPPLKATPFDPERLKRLPPRKWVYGHFLIKQYASVLGGVGGAGKTTYAITIGLSVATGRDLLEEPVHETGPVWIYNLEDPGDELYRRVWAACIAHGVDPDELVGKLHLDSGRDRPLVIVRRDENGTAIATPDKAALVAELKARGTKLLVVDPFVKSHRLEENSNAEMDVAATLWSEVAHDAECVILLVHHYKKGGVSGDADAFRGASAVVNAARAAIGMTVMTADEAKRFGIKEKERKLYVRCDDAKLNMAPPSEHTVWLRLHNITLPNGTDGQDGDRVQAARRWRPPSAWDGIDGETVIDILDAIHEGREDGTHWSPHKHADGWAGHLVMKHTDTTEAEAEKILDAWEANGLISEVTYKHPVQRKDRTRYVVDQTKLSEMRQTFVRRDNDHG
jgi:hypothetical protein